MVNVKIVLLKVAKVCKFDDEIDKIKEQEEFSLVKVSLEVREEIGKV